MVETLHDFPILVIMGKAGSGKDTLATMICEYIYGTAPSRLQSLRFSDPLKDLVCSVFGWDRDRMDDLDYKAVLLDNPPTDGWGEILRTRRAVMQFLGTDVFRLMYKDIWVDAALRKADEQVQSIRPEGFISTDCRFPNEQQAIVGSFGISLFVKINKTGVAASRSDGYNHVSETGIDALYTDMEFSVDSGDMDTMRGVAGLIAGYFFKGVGIGPADAEISHG